VANSNLTVLFNQRPNGLPDINCFRVTEGSIPEVREGELLLRTLYLSIDPVLLNRLKGVPSYGAFQPNELISWVGLGQVIASRHPDYGVGDIVESMMGWQQFTSVTALNVFRKIDPTLSPVSHALGILGVSGMTGYFGLLETGYPQAGETVVVSAAAGAVGSTAGQLARLKGAHVVGITSSPEKKRYLLDELGFDAAVSYKSDRFAAELAEACPNGIALYFDNVGGAVTDVVMDNMKDFGRIALCGQVATYHESDGGWRGNLLPIVMHSLRLQGFNTSKYADRYPEAIKELSNWIADGKIKVRETVAQGLESAPKAFVGIFNSQNVGKQLVKVSDPA
jgi:hypothetical protein